MSHLMSFKEVKAQYLEPFGMLPHIYSKEHGFVVWRMGTGRNVELLHIRAWEIRQGHGTWLLDRMLWTIEQTPAMQPYYSIYGFTRASNSRAISFYQAVGFHWQQVNGLYEDGVGVLFWRGFEDLLRARDLRIAKPTRKIVTL